MACRPVFVSVDVYPFVKTVSVEFEWNAGLSSSQKKKNIRAIHKKFAQSYPDKKVLEISSHSEQLPEGKQLSAFFLPVYSKTAGKNVSVECAYQSSKVFEGGGPYTDLLEKTSREAKKDERLKTSGKMTGFRFDGISYPLVPRQAFYDYLYCNAVEVNPELKGNLLEYDSFTDIAFNPEKGVSCQAHTAALYKGLYRAGKLDCLKDFDDFVRTAYMSSDEKNEENFSGNTGSEAPVPAHAKSIAVGSRIEHPSWGIGEVLSVGPTLKVRFKTGEKNLNAVWVRSKCKMLAS